MEPSQAIETFSGLGAWRKEVAEVAQSVREIMTASLTTLKKDAPVVEAAKKMRDRDIGDVIVLDENDRLYGIVTDRDIVVRAVAEDKDPRQVRLEEICSRDLATIDVDAPVDEAVTLMRTKSLRRLPVTDHGRPAGILSLGDLAVEQDPSSALADISGARPNS